MTQCDENAGGVSEVWGLTCGLKPGHEGDHIDYMARVAWRHLADKD